jgi:hypothetical protein
VIERMIADCMTILHNFSKNIWMLLDIIAYAKKSGFNGVGT